jgi:hypothetical protein
MASFGRAMRFVYTLYSKHGGEMSMIPPERFRDLSLRLCEAIKALLDMFQTYMFHYNFLYWKAYPPRPEPLRFRTLSALPPSMLADAHDLESFLDVYLLDEGYRMSIRNVQYYIESYVDLETLGELIPETIRELAWDAMQMRYIDRDKYQGAERLSGIANSLVHLWARHTLPTLRPVAWSHQTVLGKHAHDEDQAPVGVRRPRLDEELDALPPDAFEDDEPHDMDEDEGPPNAIDADLSEDEDHEHEEGPGEQEGTQDQAEGDAPPRADAAGDRAGAGVPAGV